MPQGRRWDDDTIKGIIKEYNAAETQIERKAVLSGVGLRRDNLKRMAEARGLKIHTDPRRSRAGKIGAAAMLRKRGRKRGARVLTPDQPQEFLNTSIQDIVMLASEADVLRSKIEKIKEILEG